MLLISGLATALITAAHAQVVTWLGTLGGDQSEARGVSDNGVVVGWARNNSGDFHAFRWVNGTMHDLGTLGGNDSRAYGVSADGSVVVGWAENASGIRAFRWENGTMQNLGTLGGNESAAYGVSADGSVVVGWARNTPGDVHAFRWVGNGPMQDLGTLPNGNYSEAYGVSADGSVVVGGARNASGNLRAFRWEENGTNTMQDLGTLGGNYSWAYGVSANGSVVVGEAQHTSGDVHAFQWVNNTMQDLSTLPGGNDSTAYGVSADGSVVVGWASQVGAVMRTSNGIEDLNTIAIGLSPGSFLGVAYAISPNGRYIVGGGYNASTGREEGWVMELQAVPEPASVIALGSGLVGLLALRRRVNR